MQKEIQVPENAFERAYERKRERVFGHAYEREKAFGRAYEREREKPNERPCDMMSPLQLFKTQHTGQIEMF